MRNCAENTVVIEKVWVGKTLSVSVLQKEFLLRRDLSRGFFAKVTECSINVYIIMAVLMSGTVIKIL